MLSCMSQKKIQMKTRNKQLSGFTLPEMLLSVALLGMLVALSVPVFYSVQVQDDLAVAVAQTGQSWRRAQTLSIASKDDETWGVYVQTGSVTLFQGASYAARDTDYDEVFEIADSITVSGPSEIVFDQMTGDPDTTGTLTFTGMNSQEFTVSINSKGMVEF